MHRNFTLEKEVDSRDGEQGWRARVESKAGIDCSGTTQRSQQPLKESRGRGSGHAGGFRQHLFRDAISHDSSAESRAGRAKEVGFAKSHGKDACSYLAYHKSSLWHYSGIALTVSPLARLVLA
jgi:hypothetical protein